MRNFTREGAAVSGRHTQGSDYPYPRHSLRRAAGGRGGTLPGGAGRGYPAGGLPGHSLRGAATRRRAAYTGRGGLSGGRLCPGRYGAHVAQRLPGRAYTRRRGYRGKRGGCSPNVGGYRARGYPGGAGGLPVPGRIPGGLYRERGYPPAAGGAAAQLPRRATGAGNWRSERAACDGYTPFVITVGGYPAGLPGGRGAKKYFSPGRLPGAKPRRLPLTRIYKKPFLGRRGEDTF